MSVRPDTKRILAKKMCTHTVSWMETVFTTMATTSMCECRHYVFLVTALFRHLKQSEITQMSHTDSKKKSWMREEISHHSIAMELIQKKKKKRYTCQTIYSHDRNYIRFKNKFSWIENTQITPLHIGIHIKQLIRELRYNVCIYTFKCIYMYCNFFAFALLCTNPFFFVDH